MPDDTARLEVSAPEYRIVVDAFGVIDTCVIVSDPDEHWGNWISASFVQVFPETVHAELARDTVTAAYDPYAHSLVDEFPASPGSAVWR